MSKKDAAQTKAAKTIKSTKAKTRGAGKSESTEKARKAAKAEIDQRIEALDEGKPTAYAEDGRRVVVSIPEDAYDATADTTAPAGKPAKASNAAKANKGGKGSKGGKAARAVKSPATPPSPKSAKAPKPPKEKKPKKVSGLDAVAIVLREAGVPMNMKTVMAEIFKRQLWASNGSTPEATLYAAVIREIAAKGKESRFQKHDRGLFTARKGN